MYETVLILQTEEVLPDKYTKFVPFLVIPSQLSQSDGQMRSTFETKGLEDKMCHKDHENQNLNQQAMFGGHLHELPSKSTFSKSKSGAIIT